MVETLNLSMFVAQGQLDAKTTGGERGAFGGFVLFCVLCVAAKVWCSSDVLVRQDLGMSLGIARSWCFVGVRCVTTRVVLFRPIFRAFFFLSPQPF